VFNLSSDGLGNKIIGTGFNCSGGVTPRGTVLAGEENFQGSVARVAGTNDIDLPNSFYIGVTEEVKPDGTQLDYILDTTGAEFGQVGEKYGYMNEIDPSDPDSRVKKHTSLGRFRHENIALRAARGRDSLDGHHVLFAERMALLATLYLFAVLPLLPAPPPLRADAVWGLASLWHPSVILFLQGIWVVIFCFTGLSVVTGATLSFHVRRERA
jgi:hypothetical protein